MPKYQVRYQIHRPGPQWSCWRYVTRSEGKLAFSIYQHRATEENIDDIKEAMQRHPFDYEIRDLKTT